MPERQIPGGPFVSDSGGRQAQIPGGAYINLASDVSPYPVLSSPELTSITSTGATPRVVITVP